MQCTEYVYPGMHVACGSQVRHMVTLHTNLLVKKIQIFINMLPMSIGLSAKDYYEPTIHEIALLFVPYTM